MMLTSPNNCNAVALTCFKRNVIAGACRAGWRRSRNPPLCPRDRRITPSAPIRPANWSSMRRGSARANPSLRRQCRHRSFRLTVDSRTCGRPSRAATSSAHALIGRGRRHAGLPRPNLHSARGTVACNFPRLRSLKAFGRRPRCKPHRRDRPASETLAKRGNPARCSAGHNIQHPSETLP